MCKVLRKGFGAFDVVITTYSTVRSELRTKKPKKGSEGDDPDEPLSSKTSPLLCNKWWRVILDEVPHNSKSTMLQQC